MIVDKYGRCLDDLDVLRMRVNAVEIVGPDRGYSIVTKCGHPVCGFVPIDDTVQIQHLVHTGFERVDGCATVR